MPDEIELDWVEQRIESFRLRELPDGFEVAQKGDGGTRTFRPEAERGMIRSRGGLRCLASPSSSCSTVSATLRSFLESRSMDLRQAFV